MATRETLVEQLAHAERMVVRWDARLRRGVNARAKWARKVKRLHTRLGSMTVVTQSALPTPFAAAKVAKRRPSRKITLGRRKR